MGDSYPGVVYDGSFPTDSYSSEQYSSDPMILPGETIIDGDTFHPESFHSSGNCPHCQSTSSPIISDQSSGSHSNGGPIFEGTIIPGDEYNVSPGYEADKPTSPMPAPAAEAVPGDTVTPTPEPEPLPASTTMMIPTFPAPKPARQVHWVPNTLK
ncbi:MAG: hypothetical protein HQ518_33150 [Rhodopirellula sp.]|nr:hypothetical protein [Rhodopirellula sp.]